MCQCHCSAPDGSLAAFTIILIALQRLEALVSQETDAIAGLDAKVTDLIDDVRALRDALQAQIGDLTPEATAALEALNAKLDAFDAEVGDADGSDTPPVEPEVPAEPVI